MHTIAWDVDDVLNDLMRAWLEAGWKPAHPDCVLCYEQLTANPPHALLGARLDEYLASLDAFRLSADFADLTPRPEVLRWFESEGMRFHHLALTAVPLRAAPASAAWVLRHFGRWIRSFHFVPSPRPGDRKATYDSSKEAFLRRHGNIDLLIDDNPAHVEGARRAGVRGILFPRPWNKATHSVAEVLAEVSRLVDESGLPQTTSPALAGTPAL
jgi:hypothetical protein